MFMKNVLCFGLGLCLIISCSKSGSENLVLKPAEFQRKWMSTPGAVLLDVRTPEEFKTELIKGAINFDFKSDEFKLLISGLDKSKPYFIYCAAGKRSAKAADQMSGMDFPRIYTLEGGLNGWKAAGLPTKIPAK
jgi:rhodanese-related sulfurtransferase